MGATRFDLWAVWRLAFLRRYRARFSYLPAAQAKDKSKAIDNMPALTDPIPSGENGWTTIEDDFLLFWASQVTHAGENTFHAPQCRVQDGVFVVVIVRYVFFRCYE
jgi:hypothetical protein